MEESAVREVDGWLQGCGFITAAAHYPLLLLGQRNRHPMLMGVGKTWGLPVML
jgi:hypothetical protein